MTEQLGRLGVEIPRSLLQAVRLDQVLDVGNRVVEHHADRPPTVLAGEVTHRHRKVATL